MYNFKSLQDVKSNIVFTRQLGDIKKKPNLLCNFTQMYSFKSLQHVNLILCFQANWEIWGKTTFLCNISQMYTFTSIKHEESKTVFFKKCRGIKQKLTFVLRFLINVFIFTVVSETVSTQFWTMKQKSKFLVRCYSNV